MNETSQTILFVDDERNILSSLRRLLRKEGWNLLFAGSALEGLEILKEQPVDLVVSDVLMPVMDGVSFLKVVRDSYPHTVRMILTGYAEKDFVKRALAEECAREMLYKPWDEAELKETIRNVLKQSESQKQAGEWLQSVINALSSLPTLPQVYLEIKDILADSDEVSADRVADVIEHDPSISARLLRWANSAMYRQANQVDTVKRAIVIMGMEMVEELVLSMSVFDTLSSDTPEVPGFNREAFWKHSTGCGAIAKVILEEASAKEEIVGSAFIAGLLHDIGKLVEDRYLHELFKEAVGFARLNEQMLFEVEQMVLGATHMEIGAYLANWWKLPPSLTDAIRWHHAPDQCHDNPEIVAAVHVADALAHQFDIGESGNFRRPRVNRESWSRFDLSKKQVASFRTMIGENLL